MVEGQRASCDSVAWSPPDPFRMLSKIKLFHYETKTLISLFIFFLEWIVEFSGGDMKCGGVTFLLSNGLCACDLLRYKVLSLI